MTVYGACNNIRMPVDFQRGLTTQDTWNVRITALGSGDEDRELVWSYPRREFSVAYDIQSITQVQHIRALVNAVGGQANTFLIQDPSEHHTSDVHDNDGGIVDCLDLSEVTNDQWTLYTIDDFDPYRLEIPLQILYWAGAQKRARRVTHPRPDEFRLYLNDKDITEDAFLDCARGLVYLKSLPRSGYLRWSGYFDTCVRFETLPVMNIELFDVGSVEQFDLVEILGEEDYSPISEDDEYLSALGRTQLDLEDTIKDFQGLVGT